MDPPYIAPALQYDIGIALVCAIFLWILFEAVKKVTPPYAIHISAAIITLAGLSNILLISYFSATLIPLGPEFWAYSFNEMTETVIASNQITIWNSIFVISAGILLFIGSYKLINVGVANIYRLAYPGILISFIAITGLAGSLLISGDTSYSFQSNKLTYFVQQSIQHSDVFEEDSPTFDYAKQEYPFWHATDHKNVLDPYFQETGSPPNIVFLMVRKPGR